MAQINSPYSRYGIGDLYTSRNVVNKGMGGISAAFADPQAVNFQNAASYAQLQTVTLDFGMEGEGRTIRNADKSDSYRSGNLIYNYLALGVPLKKNKKGFSTWGMALGLRPISRMNYKIQDYDRLPGIDSVGTLYEGSGGANRAFLGTGFRFGGFSAGFNAGFTFGQFTVSSRRSFVNDTVYYFQSNYLTNTSYNSFSMDGGLSYQTFVGRRYQARIGASGFLGGSVNAYRDVVKHTYVLNASGGTDTVDIVERQTNQPGTMELPWGYTAGIVFQNPDKWLIGIDYETANWSSYSSYGQKDQLGNLAIIRVGGQIIPNITEARNFFRRVSYRAGFYFGNDYVKTADGQLPIWGVTLGMGFPIRRWNLYSNQFTNVNTSFEFARRGNDKSPISEQLFRINVGLSLSDIWFIKRKYD
jgi:hypothetical protein